MTKGFFNKLHPAFESLSAYADLSELDAARSRIGGHVSQCAECGQVVDDIHRLGDEARAAKVESMPEGLWFRVAGAATLAVTEREVPRETPVADASASDAAPAVKPTRSWPVPSSTMSIGVGLVVALAAAVVAVVAWPGGQSLEASGLSRLTYAPSRPVAGGMMTIRYQPAPWLKGAPRLVLAGIYSAPAGHNPIPWFFRQELGDSIATLLPARDGSYEGRVRLPKDFLAIRLAVTDSTGDNVDSDGWFSWGVIAGEPTGAPSLNALLAAQETFAEVSWGEGAAMHNQRVNVSDSLTRYFPSHPAGWAFKSNYGTQKGVFSFLRFFQTAERHYLSMYEKFSPAPALDAERLHDMVAFAWRIEEPAQAEMWAKRLAKEHPEDPRALYDLGHVLHAVELRQPKGLADSIRPWFPLLDSLYRRSPQIEIRNSDVGLLAERYGDSATKALWRSRTQPNDGVRYAYEARSDSEIRALSPSVVQRVEKEAVKSCARAAGKFRLFGASGNGIDWCMMDKSWATRTLAHVALLRGDPRSALALADSSLAFSTQRLGCGNVYGTPSRIRSRALLALGDTVAAERDLVKGMPVDYHAIAYTDSARVALGHRFDAARWAAEVDSSQKAIGACSRQSRAKSDSVAAVRRERARL